MYRWCCTEEKNNTCRITRVGVAGCEARWPSERSAAATNTRGRSPRPSPAAESPLAAAASGAQSWLAIAPLSHRLPPSQHTLLLPRCYCDLTEGCVGVGEDVPVRESELREASAARRKSSFPCAATRTRKVTCADVASRTSTLHSVPRQRASLKRERRGVHGTRTKRQQCLHTAQRAKLVRRFCEHIHRAHKGVDHAGLGRQRGRRSCYHSPRPPPSISPCTPTYTKTKKEEYSSNGVRISMGGGKAYDV